MSLDNFKPTVWAGKLLLNLNDVHVYASCLNRDYEGEIREAGDTVKINSIGRVAISTYTPGSDFAAGPETLDDSQMMLSITECKMFNFIVDDVDKAQMKPKIMGDAMREAGWGLKDTADAFLASLLEAGVQAANIKAACASVGTGASDDDAYEILVDLGVLLDAQSVPSGDRWCVIPPWYKGMLLKDPRFVSFGTQGNLERLKNGQIGEAAGFTISVSNNVPVSVAAYTIIAGYKGAATYAEQIPAGGVKAYEPEKRFGDAVKGLHLSGGKVTRPYALASCVCTSA